MKILLISANTEQLNIPPIAIGLGCVAEAAKRPGETKKTVQQSFDFVDEIQPDSLKLTVGIRIYPDTPLAKYAVEKGVIAPDDGLLFPTFYLKKELENWLPRTVAKFMDKRPWVEK